MKKRTKIILLITLAFMLAAGWLYAGTAIKGLIGMQDLNKWDGTDTKTFSRRSSSGGTLTLNKVGHEVDVLTVYGNGDEYTGDTIQAALNKIGTTNNVRIVLSAGTWVIAANTDWSAYTNITLCMPPGALISHGAYTFNWGGLIDAGPYEIISGSGTVTLTTTPIIEYDKWTDGAGDDIFPSKDNAIDLGSSTQEFKDLYVDGKAHIDTISGEPFPGFIQRPKFEHSTTTAIKISAGTYYHCGTTEQLLYWDSELTFTFANLGASDWSYLYLDDSAIVTAATNLIAVGQMIDSITEPAWSHSKHGWYNGEDLCVGAVLTSGASEILEFFHDGGDLVIYATDIEELAGTDIDDTYTDVDCASSVPKFSTKGMASAYLETKTADGAIIVYWRVNGQTASTGNQFVGIERIGTDQFVYGSPTVVMFDSAQIFEIVVSRSNADVVGVSVSGWYFPNGM
jgi:hypothetical protein